MFAIIGIALVLGSVIAGYAMGNGNFHILFQPAEVIIIFGAAIGDSIISSPGKSLKVIVGHLGGIFADSHLNKALILELLLLMNAVFFKIKKEGLVAIESDIENPEKSPLFQKFQDMIIMMQRLLVPFVFLRFNSCPLQRQPVSVVIKFFG